MYQSFCLSKFLVSIVSFTPTTFFGLWLMIVLFLSLQLAINGDATISAGVLLLFVYVDFFTVYAIKSKSHFILLHLVNPMHIRFEDNWPIALERLGLSPPSSPRVGKKSSSNSSSSEFEANTQKLDSMLGELKRPRISARPPSSSIDIDIDNEQQQSHHQQQQQQRGGVAGGGGETLGETEHLLGTPKFKIYTDPSSLVHKIRKVLHREPLWTRVVPPNQPSWPSRLFLGVKAQPNRHQALFWADHLGPHLNIYLMQVHLILVSIFVSVGSSFYVSYMFEHVGIWQGALYTFLLFFPLCYEIVVFYPTLIVQMSHVACTALLKQKDEIDEIIRSQKRDMLFRMITMLLKVRKNQNNSPLSSRPFVPNLRDPVTKHEYDEISHLFDQFDTEMTGVINREQLPQLFAAFGINMSGEDGDIMFASIDPQNKGEISKDQIAQWYLVERKDEESEEGLLESLKLLFQMFDEDHTGKIKTVVFIEKLDSMRAGIALSDLVAIARELESTQAKFEGYITMDSFKTFILSQRRGKKSGGRRKPLLHYGKD